MNKTTTRPQTKQQRRQDRREEQRKQEIVRKKTGRNRLVISIVSVLVVLTFGIIIYFAAHLGSPSTSIASDNAAYPSIDGIPCQNNEQLNYHVHAHLTMYINGQQSPLPANLGIASDQSCFYWLHTHDSTGVIHIEAPDQRTFTLNTFFQEWSTRFPQMTYPTELDTTTGWTAYVNGKPYTGDFHLITLDAHKLITLAYNSPGIKPDTTYAWQGL